MNWELFDEIVPMSCTFSVMRPRIEIVLRKGRATRWNALEQVEGSAAKSTSMADLFCFELDMLVVFIFLKKNVMCICVWCLVYDVVLVVTCIFASITIITFVL